MDRITLTLLNNTKALAIVLYFLLSCQLAMGQNTIPKDSILKLIANNKELVFKKHTFDTSIYRNLITLIQSYSAIKDKRLKAEVAYTIGYYYTIVIDIAASQEHLGKALELYEELEEWGPYVKTAKELSNTYFWKPNLKIMDSLLTKSLSIAEENDVGHYILNPLQELAVFNSYYIPNYEKTIEYGNRFFVELAKYNDIADSDGLKISKLLDARIVDVEMGHSYSKLGKLDLALFHLDRAKKYFEELYDYEKLYRIYTHYSEIAIKSGNVDELPVYQRAVAFNYGKHRDRVQSDFIMAHAQAVKRMALEEQIKNEATRIDKLHQYRLGLSIFAFVIIISSIFVIRGVLKTKKIQKRLGVILNDQVNQSIKLNNEKSKYFAILSHELRTPIFAITGLTELLSNGAKLESENVNAIISSGEYLLQLVNNILQLNKIEDKDIIEICEQEFDLMASLKGTQQSLEYFAAQKNITLNFQHNLGSNEMVFGDREKLEQILVNLLSNAVKYNSANGKVDFSVAKSISNENFARYLFKITDDGVGISKEDLQSILNFNHDKFDTLVHNDKLKTKGFGIGLYIVSRFLTSMGSKLNLGRVDGRQTCFYFEIRLKNIEEKYSSSNDMDLLSEDINVLLVDDNTINLMITQKTLDNENINCITASDREPLISMVEEHQINIVLIDLSMPTIDGYEWVKKMRMAGIAIPILAHTASRNEDIDMVKLYNAGFQGVVLKPYTGQELKKKLLETIAENRRLDTFLLNSFSKPAKKYQH